MTDAAVSTAPVVSGRSLWVDAWLRLKANKAAVVSVVYLMLMTLACIIGPGLTGHAFTTIYPDYVRVAPSLASYPQGDQIEAALSDARRRARLDLVRWREEAGRVFVDVSAAKPIDE